MQPASPLQLHMDKSVYGNGGIYTQTGHPSLEEVGSAFCRAVHSQRVDLGGGVVGWGSVVFLERDFHSSVSVTNVNELPASLPGTDQTIS